MNLSFDLHRIVPIVAVGAVALVAAVLVARGLGGGSTAAGAQQVVDRALKQEPKSAALNARVTFSVQGRRGSVVVDSVTSGAVAVSPDGKSSKSISHTTESLNGAIQVSIDQLSSGGRGYIRVDRQWYELSPEQYKRLFPSQPGSSWVDAFHYDPRTWLKDPKLDSTNAHVGGVEANEVSGSVDGNKVITDLGIFAPGNAGNPIAQQLISALQAAPKSGTMSVFAGKQDGILRKLSVNTEMDATKSAIPVRATLTVALGLDKVNQLVSVPTPTNALPPARVASIPRAKLGSLAANLLGPAGASTEKPAGTSHSNSVRKHPVPKGKPRPKSNPTPGRPQKSAGAYVSCVQAAQDLASLQRCQVLLP